MNEKRRDRGKAIGILGIALLGFLLALVVGYRYFEVANGVIAGMVILGVAAFAAYELWWKSDRDGTA